MRTHMYNNSLKMMRNNFTQKSAKIKDVCQCLPSDKLHKVFIAQCRKPSFNMLKFLTWYNLMLFTQNFINIFGFIFIRFYLSLQFINSLVQVRCLFLFYLAFKQLKLKYIKTSTVVMSFGMHALWIMNWWFSRFYRIVNFVFHSPKTHFTFRHKLRVTLL